MGKQNSSDELSELLIYDIGPNCLYMWTTVKSLCFIAFLPYLEDVLRSISAHKSVTEPNCAYHAVVYKSRFSCLMI